MPAERAVRWREAAPVFAALGDETRLRVVARLSAEGPLSLTELTAGTAVTRQALTKHVSVLEQAGLIRRARHGRESVCELEPRRLELARRQLDRISAAWDETLDRLKAFVEE